MGKRLLVVGSNTIHTYTFIDLVKSYFDEVCLLTNIKEKQVDFEVYALDFRLSSFQTVTKIRKITERFAPTHIHIHQANSYAFLTVLALRKHSAKKILNAWGSDILINPKKNFILKQIVKFSLKNVDIVVADSDAVLEEAKRLIPDLKTENINFGIDFLACNGEKENMIYSNRLHKPLYRIEKIILSFNTFVKKNADWKLVIAGRGEETPKLKSLVESLGLEERVSFVGFVEKETNFKYYCQSKIYVSIPESDSVSLSLIEAIVSGAVVFVSDLKANREVIDSDLGFVVEDLEDIPFEAYQGIDSILQKKRAEVLKVRFSKEYNRQRYIEIYEN